MAFSPVAFETTDSTERGVSRTLLQFRKSPIFLTLLAAFMSEVQALQTGIQQVKQLRTPLDARHDCLDALGRIVGQPRELVNYNLFAWFTPDFAGRSVDQASVWVTNAPLADSIAADDTAFRNFIEGKVYRNMTRYGSVPEIQNTVKRALGIDVSVVQVDVATVKLVVSDSTSDNDLNLLEKAGDTLSSDHVYFAPIPATIQVSQVVRLSDHLGA